MMEYCIAFTPSMHIILIPPMLVSQVQKHIPLIEKHLVLDKYAQILLGGVVCHLTLLKHHMELFQYNNYSLQQGIFRIFFFELCFIVRER